LAIVVMSLDPFGSGLIGDTVAIVNTLSEHFSDCG
jgi:hypothetical protein